MHAYVDSSEESVASVVATSVTTFGIEVDDISPLKHLNGPGVVY